jgi:hypothetical protein
MRLLGFGWLVAAVVFVVAGAALVARRPGWRPLLLGGASLSLVLCLLAWPDAWAGLVLDLAVLTGLAVVLPRGHVAGPRHQEALR